MDGLLQSLDGESMRVECKLCPHNLQLGGNLESGASTRNHSGVRTGARAP